MLTRRVLLSSFVLVPVFSGPLGRSALGASKGEYRGRIVAEWLNDHRNMRLVEPFEYIAPDGRRWPVPPKTVVDGASIPQVFWSLIGGPFEGAYRDASVIHDYYCVARTRRFRDVHRVFYDGMKTSGVGDKRAWLMYQAVDRFGPQWDDPKIDPKCEVVDENYDFERCAKNWRKPTSKSPRADKEDLLRFVSEIQGQADKADVETLRKAISTR